MTQERVLSLSHGYLCEVARKVDINFKSLPPSSLTASADISLLPQLSGPFALFQRIVLVTIESHSGNEPLPHSNSLTAALSIAVSSLKYDIAQSVHFIADQVGVDCAQVSGMSVVFYLRTTIALLFCHSVCAAAVASEEGSFARAIFKMSRQSVDLASPVAIQTSTGFCTMCMDDDILLLLAPCGHGFCKICWEGYVSTAVIDGSTTKVKQGAEDLLDLSQLQCPGCKGEDKYQGPTPVPFLSLSFAQKICPPAISRSFSSRICDQLASKFLRSSLPGSLCICGAAIVGNVQVNYTSLVSMSRQKWLHHDLKPFRL
jgi:hypothetical protein